MSSFNVPFILLYCKWSFNTGTAEPAEAGGGSVGDVPAAGGHSNEQMRVRWHRDKPKQLANGANKDFTNRKRHKINSRTREQLAGKVLAIA